MVITNTDGGAAHPPGEEGDSTGAALVWMNERYLTECLGRNPQVKAREISDTLFDIWWRTLYASSD